MRKRLGIVAGCVLAFGGCGGPDGLGSDGNDILESDGAIAEGAELDGKADSANIPFRVVNGFQLAASIGRSTSYRTLKTRTEFRSYFGASAPASIDFSREWVTFFSAGLKPRAGYAASIVRLRTNTNGSVLKVTARLDSPSASCLAPLNQTKPWVMVAYNKPQWAEAQRYYRSDTTRNCDPPATCASVRCASGTYCEMVSGRPACLAYDTCSNTNRVCFVGWHCEDRIQACIAGTSCPPTTPECVPNATSCSQVRCAAGTYCNIVSGAAFCTPYDTCASATFVCIAGSHCEDRIVACPAGSYCPPTQVECVANPNPCASVRCAALTYCDGTNGVAVCRPYLTCATVRCASGYRCEDKLQVCFPGQYCAPTSPACVATTTPPPTFN
ncbi:MAG: hypothetical protein HYY84_04870 [Deltaproteobacteria bacterium]|nr:hypothetical protein [Deltaproteobacteria bacterium]